MKHGGIRWNIYSGQAILSLNAKRRSNLWEKEVVNLIYSYYIGAPANVIKQRVGSSLDLKIADMLGKSKITSKCD
jgi:hypothetical protein